MDLHPFIIKQLEHSNLNLKEIQERPDLYQFIQSVSHTYEEHDKDRYLLERSLEISSREMSEYVERLEKTQKLAKLAYWIYDSTRDRFTWSNEMYLLSGVDISNPPPSLKDFLKQVHPDYRSEFSKVIKEVFKANSNKELVIKYFNKADKQYYWHHIKLYVESCENNHCNSVSAIVLDITDRKNYEEKLGETHKQLLEVSRQTGMAEVATTMLHNIGNILNSANISHTLIQENLSKNYPQKLLLISKMFKNNLDHLAAFISQDPKGKLIPRYLMELAKVAEKEQEQNESNLNVIKDSLEHINEIVSMQEYMTRNITFMEQVYIPELIETALIMTHTGKRKAVDVQRNYEETPMIMVNKSKLLQIIVNLIQNAFDAVLSNLNNTNKKIMLFVKQDHGQIHVVVKDNGVGINQDNLKRVFSFGFTTKPSGHGFGLHSSAIAAKEMKGALEANSAGVGRGATFTLSLPIKQDGKAGDAYE